jgi:hypothetical protein
VLAVIAAAALAISTTGPIAAAPHVDGSAANFDLQGSAPEGATVQVAARCALDLCTAETVANERGDWKVPLNLVLRRGQRSVRVRASTRSQLIETKIPLTYPAYASVPPYTRTSATPALAVIGDSLAVGADTPLRKRLPGWKVTTDGRVGRPLGVGMDILEATPLPFHPVALAFSLFSNDDPSHLEQLDAAVRLSIERLGPRDCAIWATIVRPPQRGVPYDYANGLLVSLAQQFPDQLLLVPWADAVKRHPEWLGADRVHPTMTGYRQRARMYAEAAQQCQLLKGW